MSAKESTCFFPKEAWKFVREDIATFLKSFGADKMDEEDLQFYGNYEKYVVYSYKKEKWVIENPSTKRIRIAMAGYMCE